MNDYLVENVQLEISYYKDIKEDSKLLAELFIGGENIHLHINFSELFEQNTTQEVKKIINDLINTYVLNSPVSELLNYVDINFIDFEEQDFTENFELILYSNEDIDAGIIFNTFNAEITYYDLFKSKSYNDSHINIHFVNNGEYTALLQKDVYPYEWRNYDCSFEDLCDDEAIKTASIYELATIESENFFRRFSNQYENYLQEKYKLTPEELEEYSI